MAKKEEKSESTKPENSSGTETHRGGSAGGMIKTEGTKSFVLKIIITTLATIGILYGVVVTKMKIDGIEVEKPTSNVNNTITPTTSYPTEENQAVIEVDDTPTDIPIVVPSGKRIVFRTVNGKKIFVRDRSWDEWIAIEPGKKSRAPDQFTYAQARADTGERAYVYYFLR